MPAKLLTFVTEHIFSALRSADTPSHQSALARHSGDETRHRRDPYAEQCVQPLEPRLLLALFESDIVADNVSGVQTAYDVGARITARAHFHNGGNIGTGAFTVRFYLARPGDNTLVFIESGVVANLSPLIAWSEDINVPGWAIPHENPAITPGRYRIAAHLDWGNQVPETSETNNVAFSSYFDIRHPDLVVESVSGVESHYAPGAILQTTATVLNDGPARAWASLVNPYRIAFYLGADQSTPPNPSALTLLQTGLIQGNLDNGERTTDNLIHLIPLGQKPGRYRIWVKVDSDNELVEVNENNNWASSARFTVVGPDLVPLPVTGIQPFYSPTFGQFINADVSVQNIGAIAAEGTALNWYLGPVNTSQPPDDAERQLLQNALIRPLLSGGETSDHLLLPVSGLNPGHHRIWTHVDPNNGVDEQDETNNWSYSDSFRIISIDELRWENKQGSELTGAVNEGTEVYISFNASGFDPAGYIPVEIWEDDVIDDELERADLRVRYDAVSGRWRAPWWPAWSKDAAGTDPEFYFHIPADHLGFTFGYSSGNLEVHRRTDDFGFQIRRHTVGTGVPLVLIHGNNSDTAGMLYRWQWTEDYIRNHPAEFAEFDVYVWKHDTSKPIGFNGASGSQAASLADYIYNDLKVGAPGTPYADKRVALLAHSQGGLVSRSFMNHENQGDDVSGLITLGTPHHGSPFGVPDWVAAVWQASGGTGAMLQVILSQAMETDDKGSQNLAWDNFDGAIVDRWITDYPLNDYDLTDHDTNDVGTYPDDRTDDYYPATLKDSHGTLAALNATEAYYHKLVAIGAYDPDLSDNAGFAGLLADAAAGAISPDWSSDHRQLSNVTVTLGDMSSRDAGNFNASPYYANDGLVPLQSALFLDISPQPAGPGAAFSARNGDNVTIDEDLIAARTHPDVRIHIASGGVEDHQDILDSTSAAYWQTLVRELRFLLDDMLPTAALAANLDNNAIGQNVLNRRGYLDVSYHDAGGSGLDPRSILDDAPEFILSNPAADGVIVTGVERREGDTYRYYFDGQFGRGNVALNLIAGTFGDDAANANAEAELVFISVTDGDANGDGQINFDDYFRIDSAYLEQPANPTYAEGDFNDDGRINFDDYFIIDFAFLAAVAPPAVAAATDGLFSQTSVAPSGFVQERDEDDDDGRKRRGAAAVRPITFARASTRAARLHRTG